MVDVLIMGDEPKVLIVRNDKLGDFMLAYPSFALLRRACPRAQIFALVPEYTAAMAEACPSLDGVVVDPGPLRGTKNVGALARILREHAFDAVITLFSTPRVGMAAALARIPYRLAPASKLSQVFYNHRLFQRRSRSEKPEFQYNLDLVQHFLEDHQIGVPQIPEPPYLRFSKEVVHAHEAKFRHAHGLSAETKVVFVHPGSGGSSHNLTLDQFSCLCRSLKSANDVMIVISSGPGEEEYTRAFSAALGDMPNLIFPSSEGVRHFAEHVQFADLFVSSSTGPLHIAGALNTPTVAFYPKRRSLRTVRWQTLNSDTRRAAFSQPEDDDSDDMSEIYLEGAAREISRRFL